MLIEINKIKVADRIRKDYGDIEELARDIRENGLINPPVVTPEFVLIAGERRLKACQFLGYQQIEVRVMTEFQTRRKLLGFSPSKKAGLPLASAEIFLQKHCNVCRYMLCYRQQDRQVITWTTYGTSIEYT